MIYRFAIAQVKFILVFYLAIVNTVLRHTGHSWLARQYIFAPDLSLFTAYLLTILFAIPQFEAIYLHYLFSTARGHLVTSQIPISSFNIQVATHLRIHCFFPVEISFCDNKVIISFSVYVFLRNFRGTNSILRR